MLFSADEIGAASANNWNADPIATLSNGRNRRTTDHQRHELEPPLLRHERTFGPGTKRQTLTTSSVKGPGCVKTNLPVIRAQD
jgi:hypothetical protein